MEAKAPPVTIADDLPDAGRLRASPPSANESMSPPVGKKLADLSLAFAVIGAACIPLLLVANAVGLSIVGRTSTVEEGARWWALLFMVCISPGLASIALGQIALHRRPVWLLLPGLVALVILTMVALAFWPSSDAPFYSLLLNILFAVTYAPLFAVAMLYLEVRRDYHMMRERFRPPGQATAVTALLLGWLESGFVAWFVFMLAVGGGHPFRFLATLGALFLWNSTILVRLFLRYELGHLVRAGFKRS